MTACKFCESGEVELYPAYCNDGSDLLHCYECDADVPVPTSDVSGSDRG